MTALPATDQVTAPELSAYWEAAARGVLILPRCEACSRFFWYPRPFCPRCSSGRITWIESTGRATIYSCTTVRKGDGDFRAAAPYVVAYVELHEGVRVLTNIVGDGSEQARVGDEVTAVFDRSESGQGLLRFRRVPGHT